MSERLFLQRRFQRAVCVHFFYNIKAANQLAIDIQLRKRRPIAATPPHDNTSETGRESNAQLSRLSQHTHLRVNFQFVAQLVIRQDVVRSVLFNSYRERSHVRHTKSIFVRDNNAAKCALSRNGPWALKIFTTPPLKPQRGCSGVPFMNSTILSFLTFASISRCFAFVKSAA